MAASRNEIIIALLGLAGVLATAILSNYDKFTSKPVKSSTEASLDINVNLLPPDEIKPQTLVLVSGKYKYSKQSESDELTKLSSNVELVGPQESPYWTAKFPYLPPAPGNTIRTVTLTLEDDTGHSWKVLPFYPNVKPVHLKPNNALQNDTLKFPIQLPFVSNAFAEPTTKPSKKTCLNYPSEIKFNNWTKSSGESYSGRKYYTWRVFVDEDESILNCIAEVEYILHPTFPNPVQERTNADNKFAVEMSGWGEFMINITIKLNNGETLPPTTYFLDFEKPWP
jgi:hypothetical protein